MIKLRSGFVIGWAIMLGVLGLAAREASSLPSVRVLEGGYTNAPRAVSADTVTYGDKRIVYTVDVDTATNTAGQLRYVLDLATAPEGARMRVLMKADFDSAMIITGDTFAMSPTDSTTAVARAISWSVADPFTIALAWHQVIPPPMTNFALVMVFDTLKATWTENADDYQVEGGLNSGPGEDYTDTVAASPNLQQVVAFGSYWSCGRVLRAGVLSDNRCDNVVYADTGGAGNDTFPNEPSGHILIAQRSFTDYKEDGWDNTGTGNYLVPHTDSNAPISPSDVGRAKFFVGGTGGTGPLNTWRAFTATDTLYVAFPFKMSANWQGHSSGVNKILFIGGSDYGGAGAPVYLAAFGQDNNTLNFQVRLQGPGNETSQGTGDNLVANLASAALTRDVWYKIEILIFSNTGTNFDGELHVWIDDAKTHEYTDVKFFDDAADPSSHTFTVVKWNPIWGGVGDTLDATQYQFIDHMRISGP